MHKLGIIKYYTKLLNAKWVKAYGGVMMNKEVISDKQGIFLVAILIIGSSSIMVMGIEAKRDAWMAILLSASMAFPIIIIYARLHSIFTGKDLFDILEICFGKLFGKGIGLFYVWIVIHNAALVLENSGRFINTVSLPETPLLAPMIVISFLSLWVVKEGKEVMGRWVEFFFPIIVAFIFVFILLLIPKMQINNIQPMLYEGIKPVIKGAFSAFGFPFAETLVFTMYFSYFKHKKSPYAVYIKGLLLGGIVMLVISLANIMVLGPNTAATSYYPSYAVGSRLNIGQILQRFEVIMATVFLLGALMKISIFLLAACRGITKIFRFADYRFIVTPFALLTLNLAYYQNDSIMEIFEWVTNIWPYYVFPFQVILPVIIWIVAELRVRRWRCV